MNTTTANRGGRRILTVVIVLIVACLVCGGLAFVIAGPAISSAINTLAAPISANNDFMTAVVAKDFNKAYAMIHPSQQASFGGSSDGMQKLFEGNGWLPSAYQFANIQVGDTQATANGTASFSDGSKYVYVSLQKDGSIWKILGVNINSTAPTATPTS